MCEKISDKPKRKEKIEKLKTKIRSEIENEYANVKNLVMTDVYFKEALNIGYALNSLVKYINNENSFWQHREVNSKENWINYHVALQDINMWLQKDYNFTKYYLYKMMECGYIRCAILDDTYLGGYDYIDILGSVRYRKTHS